MLIDATDARPDPLKAALEALAPFDVERRGETFTAAGVQSVTRTEVVFVVDGLVYPVPRSEIIRIIPRE